MKWNSWKLHVSALLVGFAIFGGTLHTHANDGTRVTINGYELTQEELYAVELCATQVDIAVDPVCRMRLTCQATVARVKHAHVEHRFCSLGCVAAFATDPDRYLTGAST